MNETSTVRRSIVLPAVMTLIIVGILFALGLWQLQRRLEKHTLIAALTERLAAPPAALPPASQWPALVPARDEFRRVTFLASFRSVPEAHVYSAGSALRSDVTGPGAFVFAPVALPDEQAVVIDRGFVPEGQRSEAAPTGPVQLTGYLRFPEQAGWLSPAPDQGKRLWFVRDHRAMAAALGWGNVAPFYIDLETPVPRSGLPKPGPLEVRLKDDHMQYAVTWFGLALAVTIAFAIWLRGNWRARAE